MEGRTMKQVKKPYTKSYPVLRLFKDDLEEIVGIFKKHFTEIDIIADENQLTDIAEIDKIKRSKITHFSVEHHHYDQEPSRSGRLSLDLTPESARLYLSDSAATYLRGVASEIDALLSKKKSVLGFIASQRLNRISLIVYAPLLLILLSSTFSSRFMLPIFWNALLLIFSAIFVSWSLWMSFILSKRYCVIFLNYSMSKTNYFSRNKDQLISAFFAIFFTSLGSILTYIVMSVLFHK